MVNSSDIPDAKVPIVDDLEKMGNPTAPLAVSPGLADDIGSGLALPARESFGKLPGVGDDL